MEERSSRLLDVPTYASLLRECGRKRTLESGYLLHQTISCSRLRGNTFLQNLLVEMYAKCGSVVQARTVFNKIVKKNLFSWTIMIGAYARNGYDVEALELYSDMKSAGVKPDNVVFGNLLRAAGSVETVKEIHESIISAGLQTETILGSALVHSYVELGSLPDAAAVFSNISRKDVISWNSMLAGYAQSGKLDKAVELYHEMDVKPDMITFASVLDGCTGPELLSVGRFVHSEAVHAGFGDNPAVQNALIRMYGKCQCVDEGRAVFDGMKSSFRELGTWNALIAAYACNGRRNECMEVFQKLVKQGGKLLPDKVTFVTMLDICCSSEHLSDGKRIHGLVQAAGIDETKEMFVGNSLIQMYGKCGSLEDAYRVFGRMCERDVISWTAMISAAASSGDFNESMKLYMGMIQEGVIPDKISYMTMVLACSKHRALEPGQMIHAHIRLAMPAVDDGLGGHLVNMFRRCGSLEDAKAVFDSVQKAGTSSWNAMIAAYAASGHSLEALKLFNEMEVRGGITPDKFTFVQVAGACSNLVDGRRLYSQIVERGFGSDNVVVTALMQMYGRLGSVEESEALFKTLAVRDKLSWTCMIWVYVENGRHHEAIKTYREMQKDDSVELDAVVYVSVLEACAGIRDLKLGKEIHEKVAALSKHDPALDVENAVINMYSKCGNLEDAKTVFDRMSSRNVASWNSVMAAYVQNGHPEVCIQLFQNSTSCVRPDWISAVLAIEASCSIGNLRDSRNLQRCINSYGLQQDERVSTALIRMHAKYGLLESAKDIFDGMLGRDEICWSVLISANAANGEVHAALMLLLEMVAEGFRTESATFANILAACSHGGLVECGCACFVAMQGEFGVEPVAEHYSCMVDLFARVGWLNCEAEELLKSMPVKADRAAWMALAAGGSNINIAKQASNLHPDCAASYVLLSNAHANQLTAKRLSIQDQASKALDPGQHNTKTV